MTSPVLFSTGAAPSTSQSRNLVEFKAGKMEVREKMVHPIKRQGLVYLHQSSDDNLMHFCWKDRQSGITEDDLILFPDDCEFKRVKECTTGRVYVLKMKSSNKKMFFWMQENKADMDDDHCKRINEMLNNPPRAGSELSSTSDRDLQTLFGNMSQEQMAHLLSSNGVNLASLISSAAGRSPSSNSGASGSSTASTTNSVPSSAAGARNAAAQNTSSVNNLRNLISDSFLDGNRGDASALMAAQLALAELDASGATGRGSMSGQDSEMSQQQQPQQQQQSLLVDLSTVMNSESLAHLLSDEEFVRRVEPHLPPISQANQEGQQSSLTQDERKKQFADTIRSSQFRSSLSQFCVALQSGQLGPLMSQFGLNQACVDAANLGNLEAFVRALDEQMKAGSSSSDSQPPQPPSNDKSS